MSKRLILVAAPPAHGKNYVSQRLCEALGNVVYLDKDDLAPLLGCAFSLCGESVDMDGSFYLENLRKAEYETLLQLAYRALRFADTVLVNAPFLREVRDACYMRDLKERAAHLGAELILIWVHASADACYERMKKRGALRDEKKLARWEDYLKGTDRNAPLALQEAQAIDRLIIFDNENDDAASASLREALAVLLDSEPKK